MDGYALLFDDGSQNAAGAARGALCSEAGDLRFDRGTRRREVGERSALTLQDQAEMARHHGGIGAMDARPSTRAAPYGDHGLRFEDAQRFTQRWPRDPETRHQLW